MSSTINKSTHALSGSSARRVKKAEVQRPGKLRATPVQRVSRTVTETADSKTRTTAIEQCVKKELRRYFDMLDGEEPGNLYRMVVRQTENAVIEMVMTECRGNQTRASEWLGISRGNLRTKLANMDK